MVSAPGTGGNARPAVAGVVKGHVMSDVAVIGPHGREPRPRPLLRTTLGNVLRRRRLAQKRTLAEVARAAKVSLPYLSEVERGRKEVSSEVLAAVCEALRLELADVLTEASRDLATSRNLATSRDLATSRNLATSRDLTARRSTVTALRRARRGGVPRPFGAGDAGAGDVFCLAA